MAGELSLEHSGIRMDAKPADVLRVGRSAQNDLIVKDPRVSREHLIVRHGPQAWVIENVGRSGMFVEGQRLDQVVVGGTIDIRLASPDGPLVRFTAAAPVPSAAPPPGTLAETILPPVPVDPWAVGPGPSPSVQADPRVGPPEHVRPPTSTPAHAAPATKGIRPGSIVVGAAVLAVGAYFVAAGVGKFWPFGSAAPRGGTGSGAQALRRLLPSDAVGCIALSGANIPHGFHGLTTATECRAATLESALIFAFLFDNQADQRSSLSALNNDAGFDVSKAANSCPPPSGTGVGVGTWSNHLYPTQKNQTLECFLGQDPSRSGGTSFPIYLWAIPSRKAFVEAIAPANSSFNALNSWWQSNGGPFQ